MITVEILLFERDECIPVSEERGMLRREVGGFGGVQFRDGAVVVLDLVVRLMNKGTKSAS